MLANLWSKLLNSHLYRDERGILGTGAAIALGLSSFGAQAAVGAYGTAKQAEASKRVTRAQAESDRRALEIEAARVANEQANQVEALRQAEAARAEQQARYDSWQQFEQQRWNDYIKANQGYMNVGNQAFGQVAGLLGLNAARGGDAAMAQSAMGGAPMMGGAPGASTPQGMRGPGTMAMAGGAPGMAGANAQRGRAMASRFTQPQIAGQNAPRFDVQSLLELANLGVGTGAPLGVAPLATSADYRGFINARPPQR